MPVPWDKLDGEGEAPWRAFNIFKEMRPPRNLADLAKKLNRSASMVRAYSSRFNWTERVLAWDEEVARRESQAMISEAQQLARRRLRATSRMIERGLELIEGDDAKPSDGVRLLDSGLRYERLEIGEATDRVETAEQWDLSRLTAEEIETLKVLKAKATGRE